MWAFGTEVCCHRTLSSSPFSFFFLSGYIMEKFTKVAVVGVTTWLTGLPNWFTFLWTLTQPTRGEHAGSALQYNQCAVAFHECFQWIPKKTFLLYMEKVCILSSFNLIWEFVSWCQCIYLNKKHVFPALTHYFFSVFAVLWGTIWLQYESHKEPSTRQRTNQVSLFLFMLSICLYSWKILWRSHHYTWSMTGRYYYPAWSCLSWGETWSSFWCELMGAFVGIIMKIL